MFKNIPSFLAAAILLVLSANAARADIYQWEYIYPADPSQGKQQSLTVAPGGMSVVAQPGADLHSLDLTMAYLANQNLNGVNAQLANLTSAIFNNSNLTNANFTGAIVKGTDFYNATGFTASQLYSTASYTNGDLSGIGLVNINLTGANFANQNLTNADLGHSNLTGANFTGAIVKGVDFSFAIGPTASQLYSTASYTNGDLSGIKLRGSLLGWNFANQNLTSANFGDQSNGTNLTYVNFTNANLTGVSLINSTLTNANFAGAVVNGADFSNFSYPPTGLTVSQLYSTASYVNGDLSGIGLKGINLTGVNFANQNLTGSNFQSENTNLTSANFTGANLTGANLGSSTLTSANFTGAIIKGSDFTHATGLTASQLTSTANYANGDLSGIVLENDNIDLTGVNFANFNLASANFGNSNLTNANFTNANLVSANFDSFVVNSNLTNANFTGANLTGATLYSNMTNANFTNANLTDAIVGNGQPVTNANFTGAIIKGAKLFGGFTPSQLYSTASYAIGDLSGIKLNAELNGVNLANQNLTGAVLYGDLANVNFTNANLTSATSFAAILTSANFTRANLTGTWFDGPDLTNANFTEANLTGASFHQSILTSANFTSANLAGTWFELSLPTNANFTGTDLRGAYDWSSDASTVTHNTIRPDGSIQGLALLTGEKLVIRNNSIPIQVSNSSAVKPGSEFQILINGDAWDSTISFTPGIPVALGGTLELNFTSGMSLAGQVGRTFDLFDWTGVSPTGAFTVSSPYTWNLANLYSTGEVTLLAIPGLPGDFNQDGTVNAADYVVWRKTDGTPTGYNAWRTHFGQTAFSGSSLPSGGSLSAAVPEPTSLALLMCGLLVVIVGSRRAPTSSKLLQANSAVAVLSLVVASTSYPAPTHAASITSLAWDGVPHGVTNDGSLVVGEYSSTSFYSGFQNNAVAWRAVGGAKTLGSGVASAVTADGSVAVGQLNNGTSFSGGQLPFSPIRWTKTTTVSLGLPSGVSSAGAFGMSADGSIVMIESGSCGAGGCHNGGDNTQFYRWTQASGIVPLGFGGGWGTGVAADGSVIVGYIPGPHAFRWTATTGAVDLGTLNGATSSQANAVSADGSVVVGQSNGRAFRWTEATGMVDMGVDGAAYALSADGSIVIGGHDNGGSGTDAFYWSQSAGARLLSDVLHDDYGLDMSGWYLNQAFAISPNGRFIVGRGFTPAGNRVWMADLQVPEPRSLVLMGFASVCLFAPASCRHRN